MTQQLILDFNKKPEYQRLYAYYLQNTIFDVLGIQRNEARHSSFLAWLLNPDASHMLKEMPLRKLLALAAANAGDEWKCYYNEVRQHLLSGNYQLKVRCVKTEQAIAALADGKLSSLDGIVEKTDKGQYKNDGQNRFDIWMLLNISFTNEQDEERNWTVPVVIENKIYSQEGNASDKNEAQTVRYGKAVNVLKKVVCPDNFYQPILIYLTPSASGKAPVSPVFIHLTYQDLLDYVIQPCSLIASEEKAGKDVHMLIEAYVRNLSCPSGTGAENGKDYSILAIEETESHDLEKLFQSEAFQTTLRAVYPKESESLIGSDTEMPEDIDLLEQFWNANENLFKIVLYNHFKHDEPKLMIVQKMVKVSNRDNTRYFVAKKQGDAWMNTKAVSKSEASYLIFKAFCEIKEEENPSATLTLDDLRQAFPTSLNSYYHNRFLQHLFYDFTDEVTVDVKGNRSFGNVVCPDSDTWDFYWDDEHKLPVEGDVRSVKMWRKGDFDRLVEHAKKMGIIIKPEIHS